MARRKMSPEDKQAHDLESLRVHAFLFCREAGLPRDTVVARPNGDTLGQFLILDTTGNYDLETKGTFEECETWICAARNGIAIAKRHGRLMIGEE